MYRTADRDHVMPVDDGKEFTQEPAALLFGPFGIVRRVLSASLLEELFGVKLRYVTIPFENFRPDS